MIRVLVVDDEPAARRGLTRHLSSTTDMTVVGECSNGREAVAAIAELAPDLVFLDIEMPELGGLEVVESIGIAAAPAIVFVTAYDEHAVRAFDVHAIDYVLKPVDRERLDLAIDRARQRLASRRYEQQTRIASAFRDLGRSGVMTYARRIAIKSAGLITLVDVREVIHLSAAGNYVEVHTPAKTYLHRETISSIETRLDPARFIRVSRSSIVSVDRIQQVRPTLNGDAVLVLRDGTEISASRRYRERLDALF